MTSECQDFWFTLVRVCPLPIDAMGTDRLTPSGDGLGRLVVTNALLWELQEVLRQQEAHPRARRAATTAR